MGAKLSTPYETSPKKTDQSTTTKGQVIVFRSSSRWKSHYEASRQTSKLLVVSLLLKLAIDFTASWCRPCQQITEFAETYTDVEFIKIDVNELNDVAQEFGVQGMPTFILMKRGKEVDKVVRAQKEDLKKKIEKHRV